jgi:hypothetical protein
MATEPNNPWQIAVLAHNEKLKRECNEIAYADNVPSQRHLCAEQKAGPFGMCFNCPRKYLIKEPV